MRKVLDLIGKCTLSLLDCKAIPSAEVGDNQSPIKRFEVKVQRHPVLSNNFLSDNSKFDSVVGFCLPQDLQWPTFFGAKQHVKFNNHIFLKRNDPINNRRLEKTLKTLLNGSRCIHAWIGSPGIGKVFLSNLIVIYLSICIYSNGLFYIIL